MEPVARLTQESLRVPGAKDSGRCVVADETRPAFGCPPMGFLEATLEPAGNEVRIVAKVPADLQGQDIVVLSTIREGPASPPAPLPARTFASVGSVVELHLPYDSSRLKKVSRAQVIAHPLGPLVRRYATRPVEIAAKSELRLALAVSPFAAATGAGSTDFVLVAVGEEGRTELLRETVPATDGGRWLEHRIDLGPFAGTRVRFELESHTAPSTGFQDESTAYPLWGSPEVLAPKPRESRPNVVLISLDTVRADSIGGMTDGVRLTPNYDRLASEGAHFVQAVSTYPSTSASHMSLFTGVYPAVHEVRHPVHTLSERIPTLTELLARAGYATAAVTENAMIAGGSGFARGFDSYRENKDSLQHTGSIDRTFAEGIRWLESHRDELFFLFLHTYEAHRPYAPTDEALAAVPEIDPLPAEPAKLAMARERRAYTAEIHYADQALQRLIDELQRLDVLDETILVITSDHGEEFGEHGLFGHAKSVYDEVLRVPLLFWGPGRIPQGRTVDQQTSLVDVTPTVLELAGLRPPRGIPGRSLVQAMHGDPMPGHGIRFAEGSHQKKRLVTARTTRHKWIWREGGTLEVFDLEADPGETAPLDDPALLAEGQALIEAYLAQAPKNERGADREARGGGHDGGPAAERPLDEDTKQKLEALGYVE